MLAIILADSDDAGDDGTGVAIAATSIPFYFSVSE